eukprot:TRINITY_DN1692_c0_g1_i1.p1 TRINITY_DN1692_c0_g1~~TRINITY_DN1692_c0_g1_i1.p1  ORF type:complete len:541 (+),score=73.99 TRINITY_DN1692_c0_g1_i1:9014-10636(+)
MPLPPIFTLTGFGGMSLAVTVLIVRRIIRKPETERKSVAQIVDATKADMVSTSNHIVKREGLTDSCGSNGLANASISEPPCSTDSIMARSAAIIESHKVNADTSLLPKSISKLSSLTYDSKVYVDTYTALLTNGGAVDESAYDDAKTCSDDLESERRMNECLDGTGESNYEDTGSNLNALVLCGNDPNDAAVESATAVIFGEYEQNDELLLEPKSPILGQEVASRLFDSGTSLTVNSEPSCVHNLVHDLDYDADLDVRIEAEDDDAAVPSILTENATVSHEVEHQPIYQGSAVLIPNSPAKSLRQRNPIFVTAAPLASVPALEDVVTGIPIPAIELRIEGEKSSFTTESPEPLQFNEASGPDQEESMEESSTTTDEESNTPQEVFMNDLPTIPEERESYDNESDDVLRDSSNTQIVPIPRFRQVVCETDAPVLPMVSREKSSASSSERAGSESPAATRPLCEKDIEHVRAMSNDEAADDSEKENTFQSTSTSPERLSRKPWRSERLSNVFSRKHSMRRLRIPDRIRRRQLLPQMHKTKTP